VRRLRRRRSARAQVSEWLSFRHTELAPLTEDALLRVDARLLERTFLVGGGLTLADLALFDVVHRAVVRPLPALAALAAARAARALRPVPTAGAAPRCMLGACHGRWRVVLRCAVACRTQAPALACMLVPAAHPRRMPCLAPRRPPHAY